MAGISLIFAVIIAIFLVFLGIKELFPEKIKKKICVLCMAVSAAWLLLLLFYKLEMFENRSIIVLLMGSTILGVFYLADKKVPERWKIFSLPFYLTLVFAAYALIEVPSDLMTTVIILVVLWASMFMLFTYKNDDKINSLARKIIECCKNW